VFVLKRTRAKHEGHTDITLDGLNECVLRVTSHLDYINQTAEFS